LGCAFSPHANKFTIKALSGFARIDRRQDNNKSVSRTFASQAWNFYMFAFLIGFPPRGSSLFCCKAFFLLSFFLQHQKAASGHPPNHTSSIS
jgi:hypothetical protein